MHINTAQHIALSFTWPQDADEAPHDRRWACDVATVIDPDGVRRVYATDTRAAVQVTLHDGARGEWMPEGFKIDQIRAIFADWPTDASADFEGFNLYHANLASALRAVWRDWLGDPLKLDLLEVGRYDFTVMRIAMPDSRRTMFAANYIHALLTAIPDWTVARAFFGRNRNTQNGDMMRVDFGDVRACVMPLRMVSDYLEYGSSAADAATGVLIHSRDDAGMDWPPTESHE